MALPVFDGRTMTNVAKRNSRLVSIIIPAYNGEDTIERAIKCVLEQNYHNREVIVIDDGSTDSTGMILERYADEIRTLRQENAGIAVARNSGLEMAKGDYVAFLDQDDSWIPDKLELQVEILEKHHSVGLTFGNLEAVDKNGKSLGFTIMTRAQQRYSPSWEDLLLSRVPVPPSTIFARRNLINQIGGFDTRFRRPGYDDRDFILRIREVADFYYLDICLGSYYWRGQDWRYLPNLPLYTRKYWEHRRLQDPNNGFLRDEFVRICTLQLLGRMRQQLHAEDNQASHNMLFELNRYHTCFKEIFGNSYNRVTGLDSIDLRETSVNGCLSTLLFVYLCRSDLQKAFPEVASGDLNRLVNWGLEAAKGTFIDDYQDILVQNKERLEKYVEQH